jgi:hypothetical protein
MRHGMLLAAGWLIVGANLLQGQERVAPPPPDPNPPGGGMKDIVIPDAPLGPPTAIPFQPSSQNLPPNPPPPPAPGQNPPPNTTLPQPNQTNPPGPGQYPYPPGTYPPGPYPPGTYPPGPYPPGPYPYQPPPYPPPYGPYGPPPLPARPWLSGDPAGNPNFWVGVDALLWWSKSQPLPTPVITTGPASEGASAGNLGAPGTASLDGPLNYGAAGGMRVNFGSWFNYSHTVGWDASLFFLGQQSAQFSAFDRTGTGAFVINEPVNGAPFVTQVSAPGVETGGVTVSSTSSFWGAEVNGLFNVFRTNGWTLNLEGGFRYYELDERLNITANSTLFTPTTYTDNFGNVLAFAPPGSSVTVVDQFNARNNFYGAQAGAQLQYSMNRFFFSGETQIAVGATHEVVTVNGFTNVFPAGGTPVSLSGGNYATTQIGTYSANKFAVAPQVMLNVGYQFTPFIRGMIGYNFIYLSSVARPGNQIDNNYDGVIHPLVPMTQSSYWAQGVNFSIQFNF